MPGLWSGQFRPAGLATVTRVPLLAGPGDMVNRQSRGGHAVDRMAFSERQIEIAGSIESDCPGAVQGRTAEPRTIWCRLSLPGACERFDNARRQIDRANAVVADVATEKPATTWIHRNAVRLAQLRAIRRLAVSRESGAASPGQC